MCGQYFQMFYCAITILDVNVAVYFINVLYPETYSEVYRVKTSCNLQIKKK